jgi:uncharacterized protein
VKLGVRHVKKLLVCWFGAEPLAGLPAIRSLSPKLKSLAEKHGCTYEAKIVTNGLTLTDNIATEIVQDHLVKFVEITLDGVAEFHDARRHRKTGLPTFDTIFRNLVDIANRTDLDMEIRVRCNVDRRNVDGVLPLIRLLADAGVQRRVDFYVAPVHSWGNDAHTRSLSHSEFAELEIDWYAEMFRLGFRPKLIPSRKPIVCLAVRPLGELVDATGALFNCTEVSYVPAYGNPNKYSIGDVTHGEIPERRSVLGDFNARVRRHEYPCATCRMLPVCGGSCPKQWQEGLVPCPSPKFNIEERLLLQYALSRVNNEVAPKS